VKCPHGFKPRAQSGENACGWRSIVIEPIPKVVRNHWGWEWLISAISRLVPALTGADNLVNQFRADTAKHHRLGARNIQVRFTTFNGRAIAIQRSRLDRPREASFPRAQSKRLENIKQA